MAIADISKIFMLPPRESENVGLDALGLITNPTIVYGEPFDPQQSSVYLHAAAAINIVMFVMAVFIFFITLFWVMTRKGKEVLASEQGRESAVWDLAMLLLYIFLIPLPNVGWLNMAQYFYIKSEVRSFLAADWLTKQVTLNYNIDQGVLNDKKAGVQDISNSTDIFILQRFAKASNVFLCAEGLKSNGILREDNVRGANGDERQLQAIRACKVPAEFAETLQPSAKFSTLRYGISGGKSTNYAKGYAVEMGCHYAAFERNIAPYLDPSDKKIRIKDFPSPDVIVEKEDGTLDEKTVRNHHTWEGISRSIQNCLLNAAMFNAGYKMSTTGMVVDNGAGRDNSFDGVSEDAMGKMNRGWMHYPIFAKDFLENESGGTFAHRTKLFKTIPDYLKADIPQPDYNTAYADDYENIIPSVNSAAGLIQNSVATYSDGVVKRQAVIARSREKEMYLDKTDGSALQSGLQHGLVSTYAAAKLDAIHDRMETFTRMVSMTNGEFRELQEKSPDFARKYESARDKRHVLTQAKALKRKFVRTMKSIRVFNSEVRRARSIFERTASIEKNAGDAVSDAARGTWFEGVSKAAFKGFHLFKDSVSLTLKMLTDALDGWEGKMLMFAIFLAYAAEYLPILAVTVAAMVLLLQISAWIIGLPFALLLAPIPGTRVGEQAWKFTLATWMTPILTMSFYFLAVAVSDIIFSFSLSIWLSEINLKDGVDWFTLAVDIFTGEILIKMGVACFFYVFIQWQASKFILMGSNFVMNKVGLDYHGEGWQEGFSGVQNLFSSRSMF